MSVRPITGLVDARSNVVVDDASNENLDEFPELPEPEVLEPRIDA